MNNSKKKHSVSIPLSQLAEEWDMTAGMGILPADIPLTQNIGCVGGKPKSQSSQKSTNISKP